MPRVNPTPPRSGSKPRARGGTPRDRRVLVVMGTDAAWSRGILRGFMAAAHERDWTLLHYHPAMDLRWLRKEWAPTVAVVGPELDRAALAALEAATLVSVTVDRTADGVASVCVDDAAIGGLAADHLLATGLRDVTTFRFDETPFSVARERAFTERARAGGARVTPGWGSDERTPRLRHEDPAAIVAWLRELPTPTGLFTCTDSWGRTVARYAREAGLRVPEDLALIGADDDILECELVSPPLSSVMIPWREVGRRAAELVQRSLGGESIAGRHAVVAPAAVVPRRSTDVLAVSDPLVAKAVRWIRANADRRLTVTMIARAMGGGRQRLERRFRAALNRTVQEEIRRAHVELARRWLETTDLELVEVARRSGFTNAALLNVAVRRELGVPPGVYRRRLKQGRSTAGRDDD